MSLSSHVDDGAAMSMLVVACYLVMSTMELPRQHWPWCDVAADDYANVTHGLICI
jgi:hypothetical protein